ncbi:FdhF/YdeP family oxidoreductase [Gayadomonas joobiniege]|uniref:FdhF/YdeP family oxidoreductase n=1 Tax=Gayadomonas joobiniege TaxID=1234606 RepID=UPI0003710157|nr:FdhF/YdeP family oxidoreductase [Gayadomonas joobiniege]
MQKPDKAGGLPSIQATLKHLLQSQRSKENIKNLVRVNKDKGFDCPGCAWGDAKDGYFKFCENGAKAIAWESTEKTIDRQFFAQHAVSDLAKQSDYWLEYQGRLAEPMVYDRDSDHYQPISWSDAFGLIAKQLNALSDANQLELYTSGRASNEVSYLYQLFGRLFGTNNFPDCSNLCHEASGLALNQAIGVGKGTVTLADFDAADRIFVLGQNPGTNHPRMLNSLKKAAQRGAKIISFNNLKEVALEKFTSPQDPVAILTKSSTNISHLYLTPKLGGDMAILRGINKMILETHPDAIAKAFIEQNTTGFAEFVTQVKNTNWQDIIAQSGVDKDQIADAANLFLSGENVITCWAMGITQHKHSVATIREIVNLHLLTGQLGRPGAGLCPVRGHSNVQGNRTMGINENPPAALLNALEQRYHQSMPRQPGHNVHFALKALASGHSKILICLGGNIAAASPDTEFTQSALKNAQLTVQISTKLNRSHVTPGQQALILPCLGRTEIDKQKSGPQAVTVEDTFSMVHASIGRSEPISPQLRSETDIIANIAQATLTNKNIDWLAWRDDYRLIRKEISHVIEGFADFENQIKQPHGFHLSNSAAELNWRTDNKKANFLASQLPDLNTDKFVLQTLRAHDQYNTTIYGLNDRYRGIQNERDVIFINEKDMQALGFESGQQVDITSHWPDGKVRKVTGFKLYPYQIPCGNLAAYYPETNPLIPIDSFGEASYTPTSKWVEVSLHKSAEQSIRIKQ